ncbi:MAG: hypothetical protein WKF43_04375 [Acidimicrobiales bacterium]
MTDRDPLIQELAALDPVRLDRAPQPGSTRHAEILERAMPDTSTAPQHTHVGDPTPIRRRRPRRRAVFLLGAAAAILAVVAAAVVLQPDQALTPAAALTGAAENTGNALTLRSEYVRDDGEGGFSVVRSEHRGGDLRRAFAKIGPDGTEQPAGEGDEYLVYIGNKGWTATAGPDDAAIVAPEERNAPYAESSAAIVEAAVTESTVTEVGVDDVRGVEATHYRIRLDDTVIQRLSTLRPNQLSGFELDSPSNLSSLDVWVADGFIRRIRVTQDWEAPDSPGTTVEFYDFGADITIAPPT